MDLASETMRSFEADDLSITTTKIEIINFGICILWNNLLRIYYFDSKLKLQNKNMCQWILKYTSYSSFPIWMTHYYHTVKSMIYKDSQFWRLAQIQIWQISL